MKGALVFAIVTVSLVRIVNTETWSGWEDCISGCYKRRNRTCEIDGSSSTGIQCADVGSAYRQELQSGCTQTTCSPGNTVGAGSCLGNCYDASKDQISQCSNQAGCNRILKQRCYNETTCSGTLKQILQNCTKPCGGGNSPSYNCKGTGANIDYVDVQTTGDCNTEVCPTWSSWTSITSCSRSCGRGSRTLTSSCSYNGQPSLLCGDNKTNRTKTESCNTEGCTTTTTMSTATTTTTKSSTTSPATTQQKTTTPKASTTTTKATTTTKLMTKLNTSTTKSPTSTLSMQETPSITPRNSNDTTDSPFWGPGNMYMYIGIGAGGGVVLIIIIVAIVVVCKRKRKHKPIDDVGIYKDPQPTDNVYQETDVDDKQSTALYAVVDKSPAKKISKSPSLVKPEAGKTSVKKEQSQRKWSIPLAVKKSLISKMPPPKIETDKLQQKQTLKRSNTNPTVLDIPDHEYEHIKKRPLSYASISGDPQSERMLTNRTDSVSKHGSLRVAPSEEDLNRLSHEIIENIHNTTKGKPTPVLRESQITSYLPMSSIKSSNKSIKFSDNIQIQSASESDGEDWNDSWSEDDDEIGEMVPGRKSVRKSRKSRKSRRASRRPKPADAPDKSAATLELPPPPDFDPPILTSSPESPGGVKVAPPRTPPRKNAPKID